MAATILVAVGNGVLADSLRFSLELEGFDVKLYDEHSLRRSTIILMVGDKTQKVLARAKQAGVTTVVEEPLLGGVLLEAKTDLKQSAPVAQPHRPH